MSSKLQTRSRFHEVMIFVAGSTPQIITESIYALSRQQPPVHLDEIVIITTVTGKKRILESLVEEGVLASLCHDYGIPAIALDEQHILVAGEPEGAPCDDIRTPKENDAVGNLITKVVRDFTQVQNNRVHCSLAGGRKTMSFYLGAALQMFGRRWDKLYHVLVQPEFEGSPHFFYPPPRQSHISCRKPDGTTVTLDAATARVDLCELPFIRFGAKLNFTSSEFSELVAEGQRAIDVSEFQPDIIVNLSAGTVQVGEKTIEMPDMLLAVYTFFLRKKLTSCVFPEREYCDGCSACFQLESTFAENPDVTLAVARDYRLICGDWTDRVDEFQQKWANGIELVYLRSMFSKIKRLINDELKNEALARYYHIAGTSKRWGRNNRMGVLIDKSKIKVKANV